MDRQTLLELIQPKKDLWEKSFDDIRVVLLTIGFPISGSSLAGYLLTAHPSMVVADEPAVYSRGESVAHYINDINGIKLQDIDCLYLAEINKIFNVILGLDYARWLVAKKSKPPKENETAFIARGGRRHRRYIFVPNQYQGCFETLKVLGIKRSSENSAGLSNKGTFTTFKKRLEERNICLKFILTVRNPYDMISTKTTKSTNHKGCPQRPVATDAISFIAEISKKSMNLLKLIDPQDVFVSKHEEMVADPSLQLTKICEFAQVSASPDYLDSCTSCVVREPNKTRFEFEWTSEQKEGVASLIEQYDFFSGYDWDS